LFQQCHRKNKLLFDEMMMMPLSFVLYLTATSKVWIIG